jgi:hypothetical protein
MGTIGELEQKAGIGSSPEARAAFWLQFHLEGQACLDAGVAELKRMIAVRSGIARSSGMTRRQPLPDLDDEQVAALQAYAARHGRRWKSILNNVWMGGAPYDDGGILRRLRNTHGPSWLQRYRLPKAKPPGEGIDC